MLAARNTATAIITTTIARYVTIRIAHYVATTITIALDVKV